MELGRRPHGTACTTPPDIIWNITDHPKLAVTIIDTEGKVVYYNRQAAKILDRKPEYIGEDIHSHHKKETSNKKVDLMLQEFQKGRKEPFHYKANPYGKTILVTLSPILKDDKFVGCTQSVQLKEDIESK